MIKTLGWAALLLIAGCATTTTMTTTPKRSALSYVSGYDQGFMSGQASGRARAFEELRDEAVFRVTDYQISPCRDEVSWLPRNGRITEQDFYNARKRDFWLMRQCRERNDAKISVIIRMLDRVRSAQ